MRIILQKRYQKTDSERAWYHQIQTERIQEWGIGQTRGKTKLDEVWELSTSFRDIKILAPNFKSASGHLLGSVGRVYCSRSQGWEFESWVGRRDCLNQLKNKTKQKPSVRGEQKLDWSQWNKDMEYRQFFQKNVAGGRKRSVPED